jgi:hypothetical protein
MPRKVELMRDELLNDGEQQVRALYEWQRPAMDPATQKLWDTWCDARIKQVLKNTKFNLNLDHLVTEIKQLRDEVAELRKQVRSR